MTQSNKKIQRKRASEALHSIPEPPKEGSQQEHMLKHGYLLPSDAAQRAGVNMSTVYRMIKRGKIASVKVGQYSYVDAKSLAAYYSEVKHLRDRILEGLPK